jgi:hypothetical protein
LHSAFWAWSIRRDHWRPIPELDREDADVSLLLLAQNEQMSDGPTDDPFFASHRRGGGDVLPDHTVNALGCADQMQLCNQHNRRCTPLAGGRQVNDSAALIGLSALQQGQAERLLSAAHKAVMWRDPLYRGAAALRAHETVFRRNARTLQVALPPDQWKVEAAALFAGGLAGVQQRVVQFATGPPHVRGQYAHRPDDPVRRRMCRSQKFRAAQPSASFSVLGMVVIGAASACIIAASCLLEVLVSSAWHRPLQRGQRRRRLWLLNSTLQLQRLAYEAANMGTWERKMGPVPVTRPGELLADLDSLKWSRRLLAPSKTKLVCEADEDDEVGP